VVVDVVGRVMCKHHLPLGVSLWGEVPNGTSGFFFLKKKPKKR
jgi:hypothetical protein